MALRVKPLAELQLDGLSFIVTDGTDYTDYPKEDFLTRELTVNFYDGTSETYDWEYDIESVEVPVTKDCVGVIILKLVPITPVVGEIYEVQETFILTYWAEQALKSKGRKLKNTIDRDELNEDILDIEGGILVANTLAKIGRLVDAQEALDYIAYTYPASL